MLSVFRLFRPATVSRTNTVQNAEWWGETGRPRTKNPYRTWRTRGNYPVNRATLRVAWDRAWQIGHARFVAGRSAQRKAVV